MSLQSSAPLQSRDIGRQFDVIGAFQALETNRKMALYDLLMFNSAQAANNNFKRTIEFLWPQAAARDVTRLESFLRRRLNADE